MDTEELYSENKTAIALGNTCIGIECNDREFMEKTRNDYQPFLTPQRTDISIRFNLKERLTVAEIRRLLYDLRAYNEGERYFTVPELIECRINWPEGVLEIETDKNLFDPEVEYKLMNVLLRGLYSGIFRRLRKMPFDSYLVHGCGVVDGERCYLFTGPSGSGKTTVGSLAGSRTILNDETVLIGRNHDGFNLAGTPFDGGLTERSNAGYHLTKIFFLKHASEVTLKKLSEVDTYKRLLLQVFDTSPLFETPDNATFSEQAELCSEIAAGVPAYELGFLPDTSFWHHIDKI